MASNQTILVTNPDPAERALLSRALRRSGSRVRIAAGAQETMRILATELPTVIILADRRANSECPSLVGWIRAAGGAPDVPIVVLVPHHNNDLMRQCYEAGCDLVVSTPLDIDGLCLALTALLRRTQPRIGPPDVGDRDADDLEFVLSVGE